MQGNDWGMDRAAQRSKAIYSGIDGIHLQDQAITESMGPIVDHACEHLAPSDQMITRTRRRLLMAARALRDGWRARRPAPRMPAGLSRGAQRLLHQRGREPVAGGSYPPAGRLGASAIEPVARGRIGIEPAWAAPGPPSGAAAVAAEARRPAAERAGKASRAGAAGSPKDR